MIEDIIVGHEASDHLTELLSLASRYTQNVLKYSEVQNYAAVIGTLEQRCQMLFTEKMLKFHRRSI